MLRKSELHKIDIEVGNKLKAVMKEAGYSQDKLAKQCGITFQQIQKYCKGTNRISISRLCQISKILGIPAACLLPENHGGDLIRHAVKLERIINGYREREADVMAILAGKL